MTKQCGSIFRNKNDEFFYECEFCDEEFLSSVTFKSHIKHAHPKNRFDCESCNQKFDSGKELLKHEKKQHYEFKCQYCGEMFKTTGGRSRHIKVKHDSKPEFEPKPKRWDHDEFRFSFMRGMTK